MKTQVGPRLGANKCKRFTNRQAKRQHADYLVQQHMRIQNFFASPDARPATMASENDQQEARRAMTQEEVRFFFDSIDKGAGNHFGVVKLCDLDLDQLVAVPDFTVPPKYAWRNNLEGTDPTSCDVVVTQPRPVFTADPITLIAYAAWRSKDYIIMSLLRAGADPTCVYSGADHSPATVPIVKHLLQHVPRFFAAWVVREVIHMRSRKHDALAHMSTTPSTTSTDTGHGDPSPTCCCVCKDTHMRTTLTMTPCGCTDVCEPCVWRYWAREENKAFRVLQCPRCFAHFDPDVEVDIGRFEDEVRRVEGYSANRWRDASLEKYRALPDEPQKGNVKGKAFPLSALRRINLGTCKEQRTSELLRAAETGNAPRVIAVLEAGADVDAKNEYGQTCAFLSAYYDHLSVLRVIHLWGADLTLPANGGATPLHAARGRDHRDCVTFLQSVLDRGAALLSALRPEISFAPHTPGSASVLIDPLSEHPGAGSFVIDDAFGADFLSYLKDTILLQSPLAPPSSTKPLRNDRAYFCDTDGVVRTELQRVLRHHPDLQLHAQLAHAEVYMQMRFLLYMEIGSVLPPHTDLSRTCPVTNRTSTHTFIIYLSDSRHNGGGATALLEKLPEKCGDETVVLSEVYPQKGRLLVFPHLCPHEGREVREAHKVLLRGEVWIGAGE